MRVASASALLAAAVLLAAGAWTFGPWPASPGDLLASPARDPPPVPEHDTLVTIRAADEVRRIDPRVYSFNVATWVPDDYDPPNAEYVALVKTLEPALLRFPAGHPSQSAYFDPTSALPKPPPGYKHLLRGEDLDSFVAMARAVGAEPMLAVNLKTGTPEMAASLVRYANVEKGYGVEWFELGNEPDLEYGRDTTPAAEAETFRRFAAAMRAVDPDVKLVGGVVMTGVHVTGTATRASWLAPFHAASGGEADALSWHWYPLDSDNRKPTSSAHPTVEHLLQEEARDWPPSGLGFAERACRAMERFRAATGAEHWITELGPDSGAAEAPGITDGQAAAVWFADAVPRLAECGADAVFQFTLRQHPASKLILMRHDRSPTPAWATYALLSEHYRGRAVATDSSGAPVVAAHAAHHDDGALGVVLVNKGAAPTRVALRFEGAHPESAESWTIEADDPTSTTTRVNGVEYGKEQALSGVAGRKVDPWGTIEVPAYSVVVVRAR